MTFDDDGILWREGEVRLRSTDPSERPTLERVTLAIVDQLRRRLGGPFTKKELAELYERQGTDWCLELAIRLAPSTPSAWDMTTVASAAFARYAREARDYRTETARPPGMEPE